MSVFLSQSQKFLSNSMYQAISVRCRYSITTRTTTSKFFRPRPIVAITRLQKKTISSSRTIVSSPEDTRIMETIPITYIDANDVTHSVDAKIGKNLLDIAHENDIDLEGACGGELACSTCHLVFEKEVYDNLPEKDDEEDDMLDLAWGLTETSRLGCQIKVTPELARITVRIPDDNL